MRGIDSWPSFISNDLFMNNCGQSWTIVLLLGNSLRHPIECVFSGKLYYNRGSSREMEWLEQYYLKRGHFDE